MTQRVGTRMSYNYKSPNTIVRTCVGWLSNSLFFGFGKIIVFSVPPLSDPAFFTTVNDVRSFGFDSQNSMCFVFYIVQEFCNNDPIVFFCFTDSFIFPFVLQNTMIYMLLSTFLHVS